MTRRAWLDRPATWAVLALPILLFAAWEVEALWRYMGSQGSIGLDYDYYREVGRRWLETGEYFNPRQLAGPYVIETNVDIVYPPTALLLFVPFLWLPAILWWAIPLAVIGWVAWSFRPAPWSWPLLALVIALPKGLAQVLFGNTDLWVVAAVAAALRWGWPGVLVTLKPSVAPLALIGVRRRGWWLAAGVLAVYALAGLPLWLDYLTAMRNSELPLLRSLGGLPLFLWPVGVWLARTRDPAGAIRGPRLGSAPP